MWTVVYMTQNKNIATKLQGFLIEEGVMVKCRVATLGDEMGDNCYEVLVPNEEVEEAHNIIVEKGY